jgi:hypothetical protein
VFLLLFECDSRPQLLRISDIMLLHTTSGRIPPLEMQVGEILYFHHEPLPQDKPHPPSRSCQNFSIWLWVPSSIEMHLMSTKRKGRDGRMQTLGSSKLHIYSGSITANLA